MTFDQLMQWLGKFVEYLQNPYFLIFLCSFAVGFVLKSEKLPTPNWLIPAILSTLGLFAGAVLLSGPGFPAHVKGALMGWTLALASTGLYELWSKTTSFGKADKDEADKDAVTTPPQVPRVT